MSEISCSQHVTRIRSWSPDYRPEALHDRKSGAAAYDPGAHVPDAPEPHSGYGQVNVDLDPVLAHIPICEIDAIDSTTMNGMECLYAHAYALYRANRIDDAERLFRFLYTYQFDDPLYAIGLGTIFQWKKSYLEAIEMYATAYIIGDTSLRSVLYAGHCRLLLDDPEQARACFELVQRDSNDPRLRLSAAHYLELMG